MTDPDDDVPGPDPQDPAARALYRDRLRGRYPEQTRGISAESLDALVADALAVCRPLQIESSRDVFRFLALSVLITPQQKASTFLGQVTRRILAHTDWPAEQRLDFIYKHVVGRLPPSPEPDFGPWFVPPPLPPPSE